MKSVAPVCRLLAGQSDFDQWTCSPGLLVYATGQRIAVTVKAKHLEKSKLSTSPDTALISQADSSHY